jgi:hypothetical protein
LTNVLRRWRQICFQTMRTTIVSQTSGYIVEKINSHLGCRLQRIRLRGSARHGVVSSPALQRRMIRG